MASNGKTEQPRLQLEDHACLMNHHNNRIIQLIWRYNASTFTSAEWMVGQWLMDRGQVMYGLFLTFQSDWGFSWCGWFRGRHPHPADFRPSSGLAALAPQGLRVLLETGSACQNIETKNWRSSESFKLLERTANNFRRKMGLNLKW